MNNKKTIICRCEEVRLDSVELAITDGARTIDAVKRATRAGMGLCQGRTCEQLIARIISNKTGQPLSALIPVTSRPPFRPLKLGLLAGEGLRIMQEKGAGSQ